MLADPKPEDLEFIQSIHRALGIIHKALGDWLRRKKERAA